MNSSQKQFQLISRVSIYLDDNPDFGAFSVPYISKRLRIRSSDMSRALNVMRCRGLIESRPYDVRGVRLGPPLVFRVNPQNGPVAAGYRRSERAQRMSQLTEKLIREEILRRMESWEHETVDGISS